MPGVEHDPNVPIAPPGEANAAITSVSVRITIEELRALDHALWVGAPSNEQIDLLKLFALRVDQTFHLAGSERDE